MSARSDLASALKPHLPKRWMVVRADRPIDEIVVPTLMISQRTIEPAPNAAGNHLVTFRLTIMDPHDDENAAEDALDDEVDDLLFALDQVDGLWWTEAQKLTAQGKRAYQITLKAASARKE